MYRVESWEVQTNSNVQQHFKFPSDRSKLSGTYDKKAERFCVCSIQLLYMKFFRNQNNESSFKSQVNQTERNAINYSHVSDFNKVSLL